LSGILLELTQTYLFFKDLMFIRDTHSFALINLGDYNNSLKSFSVRSIICIISNLAISLAVSAY